MKLLAKFGPTLVIEDPDYPPFAKVIDASEFEPDDADLEANNPPLDDIFTILDFIDQVNSSEADPEEDDDEDPGWGEMSQYDLDGDEPDEGEDVEED